MRALPVGCVPDGRRHQRRHAVAVTPHAQGIEVPVVILASLICLSASVFVGLLPETSSLLAFSCRPRRLHFDDALVLRPLAILHIAVALPVIQYNRVTALGLERNVAVVVLVAEILVRSRAGAAVGLGCLRWRRLLRWLPCFVTLSFRRHF